MTNIKQQMTQGQNNTAHIISDGLKPGVEKRAIHDHNNFWRCHSCRPKVMCDLSLSMFSYIVD